MAPVLVRACRTYIIRPTISCKKPVVEFKIMYSVDGYAQYPRRRADALMLMAEAFLKDTKVASHTGDRYQVVVHVDSEVLAEEVFEAHHIIHWANGGDTSLENLIEVCHHHHQLLHEGQFSVTRQTNGALVFKRPDGTRIEYASEPMTSEKTTPKKTTLPLSYQHPWSACVLGAA